LGYLGRLSFHLPRALSQEKSINSPLANERTNEKNPPAKKDVVRSLHVRHAKIPMQCKIPHAKTTKSTRKKT
jgi:hypothetical protein